MTSTGAASLGGTLNLYTGSAGTADLINYLSYSGSFSATNNIPAGYKLAYTANQLDLVQATTATTYNLAAAVSASLLHVGDSTSVSATITNAGSGLADELNYSGLGLNASAGSLSGGTLPLSGTGLVTTASASGTQTYTANTAGNIILTPTLSGGTNTTLGTPAISGGTTTALIAVFSGNGTWVGGGSLWGTGSNSNWTDANGVQAAPGTFGGYTNTDTATFSGSGSVTTISLSGANPSLAALSFSNTSYTLSDGTLTLSSTVLQR